MGVERTIDAEGRQYWTEYFDDGRVYAIWPKSSEWESKWDYTVQQGNWTFENNVLEVQTDVVLGWSASDDSIEFFDCPSDGPDFIQGCDRRHAKAELVGRENGQAAFYQDGSLWANGESFIMRQDKAGGN